MDSDEKKRDENSLSLQQSICETEEKEMILATPVGDIHEDLGSQPRQTANQNNTSNNKTILDATQFYQIRQAILNQRIADHRSSLEQLKLELLNTSVISSDNEKTKTTIGIRWKTSRLLFLLVKDCCLACIKEYAHTPQCLKEETFFKLFFNNVMMSWNDCGDKWSLGDQFKAKIETIGSFFDDNQRGMLALC